MHSNKTPNRSVQTPGRKIGDSQSHQKRLIQSGKSGNSSGGKSFLGCEGDRYIPNRQATDLERAQHAIKVSNENQRSEDSEYRRAVTESLFSGDAGGTRILRYKSDLKNAVREIPDKLTISQPKAASKRFIPKMPEKVLDAPDIMDDFYLNILDWSADNMLAIALNKDVYIWNASTGQINCLMSTGFEGEYVSSVRWSPDASNVIAVGSSAGRVQLWDAETGSLARTMRLSQESSAARVPVVAWREHIVTSGSRSGHIRQHDTRVAHHEVGINGFHSQEVCGLAWSPDQRHLASGANDNCVAVWSSSIIGQTDNTAQPEVRLTEHQAAVKALSWCPWKNNLLCTGGGTEDHTIRFWNTTTGNCAKSVDVNAQVSGIIWNTEYREILTSHGSPKNQLIIRRYPDISTVAELVEHQGRVLCIASSPSNEMIASCASDETLRIWNCFEVDRTKKRIEEKSIRASTLTRAMR